MTDRDPLYDKMYDVICKAGGINSTISQSQFNKLLNFDAIEFCRKELNYDWKKSGELFDEIRDAIISINVNVLTKRGLIEIFKKVDSTIFTLNGAIVHKLDELKSHQNMPNRFII